MIVPIYKKWKFTYCYLWSTFYRFGRKVKSLSSHFLNSPLKFGRVSVSCNGLRFCQPQLIPRKIWFILVNKYLQETNTCLDVRFTNGFSPQETSILLLLANRLLFACLPCWVTHYSFYHIPPITLNIFVSFVVFRRWWFLPYLWISGYICTHIYTHMTHHKFNQISIIIFICV